jgi:hypothetical protein
VSSVSGNCPRPDRPHPIHRTSQTRPHHQEMTMKTTLASLVALSLFAGTALAGSNPYTSIRDAAPRAPFDQIQDTSPRSPFDQIQDTAPRTVFDDIRDTAPRSDGVFGDVQDSAP